MVYSFQRHRLLSVHKWTTRDKFQFRNLHFDSGIIPVILILIELREDHMGGVDIFSVFLRKALLLYSDCPVVSNLTKKFYFDPETPSHNVDLISNLQTKRESYLSVPLQKPSLIHYSAYVDVTTIDRDNKARTPPLGSSWEICPCKLEQLVDVDMTEK